MSSYLDLVENFPKFPEYTQFEKVLLAAKRAKDLHNEQKAALVEDDEHKAGYVALMEVKEGALKLAYREEPQVEMLEGEEDADESEDEE